MAARGYEISLRVLKNISNEKPHWSKMISHMLSIKIIWSLAG